MTDIEQALQTARERVWKAIPQYWPHKNGGCDCTACTRFQAALDANDALVRAVAKVEAFGLLWDDEGWGKTLGEGRTYSDLVRESKAEVDRLVAAMREEGA